MTDTQTQAQIQTKEQCTENNNVDEKQQGADQCDEGNNPDNQYDKTNDNFPNGYPDFDTDANADTWSESICTNMKSLSQHNISDLIKELTEISNKHGDLPVVYWDQFSACKFESFDHFCNVINSNTDETELKDENVLLFGGFHANGSSFRRIA